MPELALEVATDAGQGCRCMLSLFRACFGAAGGRRSQQTSPPHLPSCSLPLLLAPSPHFLQTTALSWPSRWACWTLPWSWRGRAVRACAVHSVVLLPPRCSNRVCSNPSPRLTPRFPLHTSPSARPPPPSCRKRGQVAPAGRAGAGQRPAGRGAAVLHAGQGPGRPAAPLLEPRRCRRHGLAGCHGGCAMAALCAALLLLHAAAASAALLCSACRSLSPCPTLPGFCLHPAPAAAEAAGKQNIAFLCHLLLGRLDACIDLLLSCGRLPEAAFFARTYVPSRMSEVRERSACVSERLSRPPAVRASAGGSCSRRLSSSPLPLPPCPSFTAGGQAVAGRPGQDQPQGGREPGQSGREPAVLPLCCLLPPDSETP